MIKHRIRKIESRIGKAQNRRETKFWVINISSAKS